MIGYLLNYYNREMCPVLFIEESITKFILSGGN